MAGMEEMDKLESFVNSVEPYSCNHEVNPKHDGTGSENAQNLAENPKIPNTQQKTMIVIGPTGVGKSTFCNVIAGKDPMDQSIFPVSDSGESVTNKTSGEKIEWRGSGGFPVTLIDTPGLSDSSEDDFKNISGMLKELEKHSEIHVFVLTVNGTQLTFSRYFKDMILIFQLCYGPQFLNKNTIVEVTHWSFDDVNIQRRKIDEKTLKQKINEELKKIIPKLQDLEVIFVDAMHSRGYESKHDKEKTKFIEEMDKLESFMTSVEPYSCNHEAFPGVNGLFQTIHSNNERKEQEKNKEIEVLNHENEKLKKKEQTTGRMIKIERIVQLVSIIIALILVSTLVGVYFHFLLEL
jgi:predicted GTPase